MAETLKFDPISSKYIEKEGLTLLEIWVLMDSRNSQMIYWCHAPLDMFHWKRHISSGILAQNVKPQSRCDKTLNKLKLGNILQNTQLFRIVKAMKAKERQRNCH